jgi:hypothetical protein
MATIITFSIFLWMENRVKIRLCSSDIKTRSVRPTTRDTLINTNQGIVKATDAESRIYFFALLVQALIERETRMAMQRGGAQALALYPEHRDCKAPSARRVLDLFDNIQRHELVAPGEASPVVLTTKLSPLQERVLKLLEVPMNAYRSAPT